MAHGEPRKYSRFRRTETGWQPSLTFVQALTQTWTWYAKQTRTMTH